METAIVTSAHRKRQRRDGIVREKERVEADKDRPKNNFPIWVACLHAAVTKSWQQGNRNRPRVSEANVFDYIRRYADGKLEGNETGKIIKKTTP